MLRRDCPKPNCTRVTGIVMRADDDPPGIYHWQPTRYIAPPDTIDTAHPDGAVFGWCPKHNRPTSTEVAAIVGALRRPRGVR